MTKGQLGPVEIVLPAWLNGEDRYRRTYKAVEPSSRIVVGDKDAVAPEQEITTWKIDDWSGGEGSTRWRDDGTYRLSTGAMPASDGSGLVSGPNGLNAVLDATATARGGGRLVLAGPMNGSIWYHNGTNYSTLWSIGGSASYDAQQLVAIDDTAYFVLDTNGDIRKVTSGGNTAHYTGGNFTGLAVFDGTLFGVSEFDLYEIDASTASTRTLIGDAVPSDFAGMTGRVKQVTTSEVGVVWYAPTTDGVTLIREYNFYDDVASTIGRIPDDTYAYDIAFYSGIYFVSYRYAGAHDEDGEAYLYYKLGGQSGFAGEFRRDGEDVSSEAVAIGGVIGDRLYVGFNEKAWAYDLSSGGIVMVGDMGAASPSKIQCAQTYGSWLILGGNTRLNIFNTNEFENSAGSVYSGMGDYGYVGIPKLIHTATLLTEEAIESSGQIRLGYKLDGGAEVYLSPTMTSGSRYQWDVSTVAGGSVIGSEVEWIVEINPDGNSASPKVVAVASDASGAAARIEWAVMVDVGQSSVNDGSDVISALNTLKTTYGAVSWGDPYQLRDHQTPVEFDVRVKSVSTPELSDDGFLTAMVVFQTIGMVGPVA